MIRLIITGLFVVIFLIISLPIQFVEWILRKFNRYAADISSLRIVQWAFKVVLFTSGVKVTVIGEENIPKDRTALYIGNHKSIFDIVVTYPRMPRLTGYYAKESLEKVPGLNIWMRRLYCLFLHKEDMKQQMKMILTGIDYLKSDVSMAIFPEGQRNRDSEPVVLPFKQGSFKLAEKTLVPIVPMALTNTEQIFENQAPFLKKTHVILQYGKPIETKDMSKEELKNLAVTCQAEVERLLEDNKKYL